MKKSKLWLIIISTVLILAIGVIVGVSVSKPELSYEEKVANLTKKYTNGVIKDSSGKIIKELNYSVNGDVAGYVEYKYYKNGVKKKTTAYDIFSDKIYFAVEYDKAGNNIIETYYNPDGSKEYTTYEYDENNNVIKNTRFNKDETVYEYAIIEYDENGNEIKSVTYDADDNVKTLIAYDENGNSERTEYDENGNIKSSSEYDKDGKRIKDSLYHNDSVYQYVTYEYDENFMIKESRYDANGTLLYSKETSK